MRAYIHNNNNTIVPEAHDQKNRLQLDQEAIYIYIHIHPQRSRDQVAARFCDRRFRGA